MSWIHRAKPGDKVVCIRDDFLEGYAHIETRPVVGGIYTIREIDPNYPKAKSACLVALRLVEIRNPVLPYIEGEYEAAWNYERFRPVEPRKTDISIFTDMLKTVGKPVTEDA